MHNVSENYVFTFVSFYHVSVSVILTNPRYI